VSATLGTGHHESVIHHVVGTEQPGWSGFTEPVVGHVAMLQYAVPLLPTERRGAWSPSEGMSGWAVPSESVFKHLAEVAPEQLLALVQGTWLAVGHLTLAAEVVGGIREATAALRVLRNLLHHRSPMVREGAVLGLGRIDQDEARRLLTDVAHNDPSPGVRRAAEDFAS
jgi:hypothetical protein